MVRMNLFDQNKLYSHSGLIVFASFKRNIFQIVLVGADGFEEGEIRKYIQNQEQLDSTGFGENGSF